MVLLLLFSLFASDLKVVYTGDMPQTDEHIADTLDGAVRVKMKDGALSHGTFVIYGSDEIWAARFSPSTSETFYENVTQANAARTANIHSAYSVQRGPGNTTIIFSNKSTFPIDEDGERIRINGELAAWDFSYDEHVDWSVAYTNRDGEPQSYKPLSGRNYRPVYIKPGVFVSLHLSKEWEGTTEVAESYAWRIWSQDQKPSITPSITTSNGKYAAFRKNRGGGGVVESWSEAWFPSMICESVLLDRVALSPDRNHLYRLNVQTGEVLVSMTQNFPKSWRWKSLGKLDRVYVMPLAHVYARHARISQSFKNQSVPGAADFAKASTVQTAIDVVKSERSKVLLKPTTQQVVGGRGEFYGYAYDLKCDPAGNLITVNYSMDSEKIHLDVYSPRLKLLGVHQLDLPGVRLPSGYLTHVTNMSWFEIEGKPYLAIMQPEYSGEHGDFPRYSVFEWPYTENPGT